MAGEEVFHALAEGELDVDHAAVAEHHDEEARAGGGWRRPATEPTLPQSTWAQSPGREGEAQVGGLAHGPHRAHVVLEDAVAAGVALRAQPLEDLRGAVGMALEQGTICGLKGSSLLAAALALALLVSRVARSTSGHRFGIEIQLRRRSGRPSIPVRRGVGASGRTFRSRSWPPPSKARRRMSATDLHFDRLAAPSRSASSAWASSAGPSTW